MKMNLTSTVISTCLILVGGGLGTVPAYAGGATSDEIQIYLLGPLVFDQVIAELPVSGVESAAIWNQNAIINSGSGAGTIQAVLAAGGTAVALIDPAGEILQPGETCVPLSGPNTDGPCISDIVVAMMNGGGALPTIAMFSDPHPVITDPNLPFAALIAVQETGQLQDISGPLLALIQQAGLNVMVSSDVETVPVPAAAWLFGSALGLLGIRPRKRAGA
jgi:hypothetical protein